MSTEKVGTKGREATAAAADDEGNDQALPGLVHHNRQDEDLEVTITSFLLMLSAFCQHWWLQPRSRASISRQGRSSGCVALPLVDVLSLRFYRRA